MGKILIGIVLILFLFVGVCSLLYLFQGRMIFFPQPTEPDNLARYAGHEIRLRHGDITLTGWFLKKQIDSNHPLIIYHGGNAEDISLNLNELNRFATHNFLFMNYRGYGQSQGEPSERSLLDDALYIFDQVIASESINPSHVVLMGRSLGSGVAVHVAAKRRVGGVILVTPFDSLVNVAKVHYPIFPVGLLLRHRFESAALAPGISTPALFLTASDDEIVPTRLANNLQKVWGGPTTSVCIQGAGHNTIEISPEYWKAINDFISGLSVPFGS